MNWKFKAAIAAACAITPMPNLIYSFIQKRFGRLNGNPEARISSSIELARTLANNNKNIQDATILEVGTGHKAIIPVCLFLMGAKRVYTVDLNRRLEIELMKEVLQHFSDHETDISQAFAVFSDPKVIATRFKLLSELKNDPLLFMNRAEIQYLAPGDASSVELPDGEIDLHISTTTLEHIPEDVLVNIFKEANRILQSNGLAVHLIDLSDHFAHQDSNISPVNFLRYSNSMWKLLAGNQFSYTNRLRRSDYRDIWERCEFFSIEEQHEETTFVVPKVASSFSKYSDEELAGITYNVVLTKK